MEIKIRPINKKDLSRAEEFTKFINSFVDEDAMIAMDKKISLKEEKEFLLNALKGFKKKNFVYMIAECDGKIAGSSRIVLGRGRGRHVGVFGITIRKDYRGIGLGTKLMTEMIKFSKAYLKDLKIIELRVFEGNKVAMGLYKKMGFKKIAKLPKYRRLKGKFIDEYIMIKEV